ncbi:MAG TPA: hypothetical protein VN923_15735 [Thermoanaerobaculia bacterium]|nr:hypothetical protein [Thermoanaerobaculia bacterium]
MRIAGLLALSCFLAPVALRAQDPPRLAIAEAKHEIDQVALGTQVRWPFRIENTGGAPVTLQVVGVTDLCKVESFPATLAPKQAGDVVVVLDTKPLAAPGECTASLRSNDSEHADVVLNLAVAPQNVLRAKPGYGRYTYVQGEKQGTIRQLVAATDGKQFRILGVSAPPQFNAAFRLATDKERDAKLAGPQWIVATTIVADAAVGPIKGYVEVRTDHPVQKVMRVPLSGFVRPVMHVTPPEAAIGEVTLSSEVKLDFFVRNFATEPIHVVKVESSVPGTRAEITPREEGRSWDLHLVLTPTMGSGKFAGNLTIVTDSSKVPKLMVPVSGSTTVPAPATG